MSNTSEDQEKFDDYSSTSSCQYGKFLASPPPGDEVVITGISGAFPDSRNVHEFRDNLLNKTDMVTCDNRRWEPNHPEIPQRTGKLWDLQKFDAGFFGVHYRQAETMDPSGRHLLEKCVEALIDAGIHPSEVEGTNTGVFIGASFSETEKTWFYEKPESTNYALTGTTRSMLAKRLSYYFKLKGPTFVTDTACSSTLYAVEHAYRAIRNGSCDTAIVGGGHLCLHPYFSLQFARLGVLSPDGRCKVFDKDGDGYARSETIAVIILQKAKNARRIYSTIVHAQTNSDGFKPQSITFPSSEAQTSLLQNFYTECAVDPISLSYLEAHGTGTTVGDPEELLAIDQTFCKNNNRPTPLLVGSVKSSIGHTEPCSGICSIAKVVVAMETGLISGNLHFNSCRSGVESLEEGRLKVVTQTTPFEDDRGLVGVNGFGFGGANAHVLLKWNEKRKINGGIPEDDLPRIVCVSGRTEEGLNTILGDLNSRGLDCELVRLYHQAFSKEIVGHFYKGYTIISKSGELKRNSSYGLKKKLYLAFTDFGHGCNSIAKQFATVPVFAASIQRIHNTLTKKGVNITQLISNEDKSQNSKSDQVLATAAVQIALVDVLKAIQIQPSGYFGFGFGEFICGYFDDCLTLQETLEAVHFLATNHTKLHENRKHILKILNGIISQPKSRSSSWISTCDTRKASAEYFEASLVSCFNLGELEERDKVPRGSVVLEVGAGKVQNTGHIELLSFDSAVTLFETLGRLHQLGHSFSLDKLYPKIEYPVSRGTPMIAPHIKWDHRKDWEVSYYENKTCQRGERSVRITSLDGEWNFIAGHEIDGRNLFPATGYLFLAWVTFSKLTGFLLTEMRVVFENCRFMRATTVSSNSKVEISVMVQRGSGNFEVIESGEAIVSGNLKVFKDGTKEVVGLPKPVSVTSELTKTIMTTKDVYKELRLRGYNYKGMFRSIVECDSNAAIGLIHWDSTWITFMDNMLQMKILQIDSRNLFVPTGIQRLTIDAKAHLTYVHSCKDGNVPVYVHKEADIVHSGGIEIRGIRANAIVKRKPRGQPVLEKYQFIPDIAQLSLQDSVRVIVQLAFENLPAYKVKAVELIDEASDVGEDYELLAPIVHECLGDLPLVQPIITVLSKNEMKIPNIVVENKNLISESDCMMVIGSKLLQRPLTLNEAFSVTKDNGFVLSREPLDFHPSSSNLISIDILATHITPTEKLYLVRKRTELKPPTIVEIPGDDGLTWLPALQKAVNDESGVIIVAQNSPLNGVLGLINCLRREPGCGHIRAVITFDGAPKFSLDDRLFLDQINKNLAINVYKNSSWGTYRHLLLDRPIHRREHCFANVATPGDLSTLKWYAGGLTYNTNPPLGEELVSIYYSALNFRNIMTASGRISADGLIKQRTEQDFVHGFEYSGKTVDGSRVMGFGVGSLASMVTVDKLLAFPVPQSWTLEEAATVPVVYLTTVYSLFIECSIRKGQSILIHAGSGGIGQAAINLSLHRGLTVFTTVGTSEKREFLKKQFPQLTDENIGNSRDLSFEDLINKQTKGEGVDYVLNSLSEDKLMASVRCLKADGHFIEIGKYDMINNNYLKLKLLARGCAYHGIMVDEILAANTKLKLKMRQLLTAAIADGSVKPLVRTVFQIDELEQAFRYMAVGKHVGKVLIQIRSEQGPQKDLFDVVPRISFDPDKVQIIVGGLGGFGLELADWLILRGARKLILTSRRGVSNGYQSFRFKTWLKYGTQIKVSVDDVTTKSGCQELLKEALTIGEVESIFNLAVVLKDGIFENQTQESFEESLNPKAVATKFLDETSRVSCKSLKNFVVFSSVSCGRGNAGQTNYGMANSIMERICERRKCDNLPGLAIQWGAVGDVGLVADMQEEQRELEIGGTLQQKISNCLEVLDSLISQDSPIVSSMVVAEKRGGVGSADNLVDAVANILGLKDLKIISLHASLSELGMDSMTAVEIKQTLEREYEVFLTPTDIRSMTFARLIEIQEERDLEDEATKKDRAIGGFDMILRYMTDEETSKIPLLTLRSDVDDTNPDAPSVVMLPGLEGIAKVLEPLAANLKARVRCLQFLNESQHDTIPEMAGDLVQIVEPCLSKSQPFFIVGYSYGGIVGLELVSLLERMGYFGTYVSVDGTVDNLGGLLRNSLSFSSEALFQTGFIMQLTSLLTPVDVIYKNRERFMMARNLEDRLKIALELVPKDIEHSPEYLRALAIAYYKRLKALGAYESEFPKLRSTVKLLKPQNVGITGVADDYRLSEFCEHPVEVKTFSGNHVTFLSSPEMADEINKMVAENLK